MVADPAAYAGKVADFLDIPLDVSAMGDVPQEQFYRQRK
jgi:hypothetical protein